MAWIDTIPEDEATGRLARIYASLVEPWGGVDNILEIHSLNPPSLTAHARLYETLMRGDSELSRIEREMSTPTSSRVSRGPCGRRTWRRCGPRD